MRSCLLLISKAVPILLFIVFIAINTRNTQLAAQSQKIDSLREALLQETSLQNQFALTAEISTTYIRNGKMDSIPAYLKKLFEIAEQLRNDSLLMLAYMSTAQYFDYKTDIRSGLEYIFKAQKIAEEKYPATLPLICYSLGTVYEDLENYRESLKYLRKTQSLSLKGFALPKSRETYYYFHFATVFVKLNQPDSALHYIQIANVVSLRNKDDYINTLILAYLGVINEMLGNIKLAENYYVSSIETEDPQNAPMAFGQAVHIYCHFLLKQHEYNKAKYFATEGLSAAKKAGNNQLVMNIAQTLRHIYESLHKTDSAYHYSKLELSYRDSLFNLQKANEIQNLIFNEELRQIQEAAKQKEASEKRKRNIQYGAIALGIIALLIIFLLLGRSIIISAKVIEFVGIISLLIVFEFINLLVHPFLEKTTNHSPVLMLLALVFIASLLVPLHDRFEKWMIHKMVEKNKKIRLAAAKKVIATLGKETT